jgi:hypothetical protein
MKKNSFGVKVLQSTLFFLAGLVVLATVLPVVFSFFGPMITAFNFETPMNFMIADYVGMSALLLSVLMLLIYTKKWMWH